jgi:hypothetical protein
MTIEFFSFQGQVDNGRRLVGSMMRTRGDLDEKREDFFCPGSIQLFMYSIISAPLASYLHLALDFTLNIM